MSFLCLKKRSTRLSHMIIAGTLRVGFCLPTVWLCKVEGGMVVTCGCFHPKFLGIQGMGQKYIVLVWHSEAIQLGYFPSSSFMG